MALAGWLGAAAWGLIKSTAFYYTRIGFFPTHSFCIQKDIFSSDGSCHRGTFRCRESDQLNREFGSGGVTRELFMGSYAGRGLLPRHNLAPPPPRANILRKNSVFFQMEDSGRKRAAHATCRQSASPRINRILTDEIWATSGKQVWTFFRSSIV